METNLSSFGIPTPCRLFSSILFKSAIKLSSSFGLVIAWIYLYNLWIKSFLASISCFRTSSLCLNSKKNFSFSSFSFWSWINFDSNKFLISYKFYKSWISGTRGVKASFFNLSKLHFNWSFSLFKRVFSEIWSSRDGENESLLATCLSVASCLIVCFIWLISF
jgi:hypothetical protein